MRASPHPPHFIVRDDPASCTAPPPRIGRPVRAGRDDVELPPTVGVARDEWPVRRALGADHAFILCSPPTCWQRVHAGMQQRLAIKA